MFMSSRLTDAYGVLGLSNPVGHATPAEVRAAYKRLAVKLHPDKNSSSSSTQGFVDLTQAYRVALEHAQARADDPEGSERFEALSTVLKALLAQVLKSSLFGEEDVDVNAKPPDVVVSLVVSLRDVYFAQAKVVGVTVQRGDREHRVSLVVPLLEVPGRTEFRFEGDGDVPEGWTGRPGDVVVNVTVDPETMKACTPDTVLHDRDLHAVIDISPKEFYYGASLMLEHPSGVPVRVVYERADRGGRRRRSVLLYPGLGLPRDETLASRGDLYVFLELCMPELSDEHLTDRRVWEAFDIAFVENVTCDSCGGLGSDERQRAELSDPLCG